MERDTRHGLPYEVSFELELIYDSVVEREFERHPELNSRRKKLIFIQEAFGIWNPTELGNLLNLDEKTTRRFISRRGIRNPEYETIQRMFDGVFAITSIIEKHIDNIPQRRDAISKSNSYLNGKSIGYLIHNHQVEEAVFMAERSFRHFHENN